jgi:hypothetical protein
LVYDPPATVPPFSASPSSLSSSSNLSPCQLLHQHPSHTCLACSFQPNFDIHSKQSWCNFLAT